ncbi:MAG: AI-2E family transporter [Clostridiales bacterium]|jgi:predicted PurR-regulated permease PerM|nr:AI-2E family transporter [Clostridiales bacterium]
MKRLLDRHQLKVWVSVLLLAAAIIVVFNIVGQHEVIFGWISRFFWVIAPFVWGFLVAYVLNIPRERLEGLLERWGRGWVLKRRRGLSVALIYVILIAVIWIFSYFFFPAVYENVMSLVNILPSLFQQIQTFLYDLEASEMIPFIDFAAIANVLTFEDFDAIQFFGGIFTGDTFTNLVEGVGSFFSFLFRFVLTLISSVYFMAEGRRVRTATKRLFKTLLPIKVYEPVVKYGREINHYFKRYIYCQVLDAFILGTIMVIVLSIIGVDYGIALGVMLGFANLIPMFGAIIGTIAAFIVIVVTDGLTLGIISGIVMLVIQQVDANFIFPRLIGGSMKVSPLLVIIGIAIGSAYQGVIGMIIAIPIVTVVRNIIDDLLVYINAKKAQKSMEV